MTEEVDLKQKRMLREMSISTIASDLRAQIYRDLGHVITKPQTDSPWKDAIEYFVKYCAETRARVNMLQGKVDGF